MGTVSSALTSKGVDSITNVEAFEDIVASMMEAIRFRFPLLKADADVPAGFTSSNTRFEIVKKLSDASPLSPGLKGLVPYLPFVLSGYDPHAEKDEEKGAWSFTQKEANNVTYEIKKRTETKLIADHKDARCSLEQSTRAALKRLEDVSNDIKKDSNYILLCHQYRLPREDNFLLSYATIMSFRHRGDIYVSAAMEGMINHLAPSSEGTEHELAVQLAHFVKETDSLQGENEKGKEFLVALPFMAQAFRNLEKSINLPPSTGTVRALTSVSVGTLLSAVVSWLSLEGSKSSTRRGMVVGLSSAITLGAALGSDYLSHEHISATPLPKKSPEYPGFQPELMSQEAANLYRECSRKGIFRSYAVMESTDSFNYRIHPHDPVLTRCMGEASYDRFQETSDRRYLLLARHYFEHCRKTWPDSEKEYIDRALKVTGSNPRNSQAIATHQVL